MYYLTFIFLFIIYLLHERNKNKRLELVAMVPLFLLVMFRFGFGADYLAYEKIYYGIKPENFISLVYYYRNIELGFKLIMWPFRVIGINYQYFLTTINGITLILIYKWLKDNSENVVLSIISLYAMFYFVWVFSALRQGLVISISLYLLFNKNKNLKLSKKIVLITLLTMIHRSALILFLFIGLDKISWTKKRHFILLLISIFISFLPVSNFLNLIDFLPSVNKILSKYITDSSTILDIPGLVRLTFFFVFLFLYDDINKKNRVYVDRFLFGIATYFVFKFSELTAARLTIYTFFNLIILIPILSRHQFTKYKIEKTLKTMSIFVFLILFFNKEINSMRNQAAYLGDEKYVPFVSVFNKDYGKFGSKEAYDLKFEEFITDYKEMYLDNRIIKTSEYSSDDDYIVVEHKKNAYRIINQNGRWLEKRIFYGKIDFFEGIISRTRFEKNHYFGYLDLEDISGKDRSQAELEEILLKKYEYDALNTIHEKSIKGTLEYVPDRFLHLYPDKTNIKEIKINQVEDYYILRVSYYNRRTFIYLDANFDPMFDIVFVNAKPFGKNEMAIVDTSHGEVVIHKDGKIIWWTDN